jgi:hypothetical protein
MNGDPQLNFSTQLTEIATRIHSLAQSKTGDTFALLELLRTLESLHRQVQEGLFQDSLPSSRHDFYALMKDIEENGGWPYIERGKIQALRAKLIQAEERSSNPDCPDK